MTPLHYVNPSCNSTASFSWLSQCSLFISIHPVACFTQVIHSDPSNYLFPNKMQNTHVWCWTVRSATRWINHISFFWLRLPNKNDSEFLGLHERKHGKKQTSPFVIAHSHPFSFLQPTTPGVSPEAFVSVSLPAAPPSPTCSDRPGEGGQPQKATENTNSPRLYWPILWCENRGFSGVSHAEVVMVDRIRFFVHH